MQDGFVFFQAASKTDDISMNECCTISTITAAAISVNITNRNIQEALPHRTTF
jgi:hypothetical protein